MSDINVYVFYKDTYIGDIKYNEENDSYRYIPKLKGKIQDDWIYITNANDPEWFKETIIDTRCIDPNRVTLRDVLHELNMIELIPFEYMCKTLFMSETDMYWACKEFNPKQFWIRHPLSVICPEYKEKFASI